MSHFFMARENTIDGGSGVLGEWRACVHGSGLLLAVGGEDHAPNELESGFPPMNLFSISVWTAGGQIATTWLPFSISFHTAEFGLMTNLDAFFDHLLAKRDGK